jgi:hypothetical protein
MDQKVVFDVDRAPAWLQLRDLLSARGLPLQLRMIDGELAFPDEEPAETWHELRVGTPLGMVTLRREDDGVRLVTWGNADVSMRQAWNALTWATAKISGGFVETPSGRLSAADFARTVELPAGIGGESGGAADVSS